jgi:hypothetical protein
MHHRSALTLVCLLATAPAFSADDLTAAQASLPQSVTLTYRTTANMKLAGLPVTLHAQTTTQWSRQGARYQAHLHMDSTVSFDQDSSGQILADGMLAPTHYEEKRPFHQPDVVQIDWSNHLVRFGADPLQPTPAPGSQDRLALQFQLAQLLHNHPERLRPGSYLDVNLIGTHDVDPWRFMVSEDGVQTGQGSIHAMRVSARRVVNGVEETMDVWLGQETRHLPVRIRFVDRNASVVDSILEHFEVH